MGKRLNGMQKLKNYFFERPKEKVRVSEILRERKFKEINEYTLRVNIRNLLVKGFLLKKLETNRVVFYYLNPKRKNGK